jgi:hypothetical protein
MMMDAIEMQKNKTQRLLDLDALSSSDWDTVEQMVLWWASQETMEWVGWSWKILDLLALECSSKKVNENDMESQLKGRWLLGSTLPSIRGVSWFYRPTIRNGSVKRTTFNDDRKRIEQDRQFCSSCFTGRRDYAGSF